MYLSIYVVEHAKERFTDGQKNASVLRECTRFAN